MMRDQGFGNGEHSVAIQGINSGRQERQIDQAEGQRNQGYPRKRDLRT
jgi:hypothetical protein